MSKSCRQLWIPACIATALQSCQVARSPLDKTPSEDERIAELAVQIQGDVESFRGIRFEVHPTVERILPTHRCDQLDSAAAAGWVAAKAVDATSATDSLWTAAGLLRPGTKVGSERRKLDCVASRSLYQVEHRRILIFSDSLHHDEERLLAHEMVHALQDQRSDLRRQIRSVDEPDERLGLMAALEGEAEFVAARVADPREIKSDCKQNSSGALWQLNRALETHSNLATSSPSVSFPAYAPYVFGENLACRLYQRYGIGGLDTLFFRPPRGSWQLWHFDAYLENRLPVDWDTAWATFPPLPSGWFPRLQARAGEARLAGLPLTWDRSVARSLLTGSGLGWAGDRVWMAGDSTGRIALFWRLTFSDASDARAFAKGWWTLRAKRMRRALPALPYRANSISWTDSTGANFAVKRQGADVAIAEGLAEPSNQSFLEHLLHRRRR